MAIKEFIYPRFGSSNEAREKLGVLEIPPYAEEMRINSAWIMDGEEWGLTYDGPIDSDRLIATLGRVDTGEGPKEGGWASWCINFYPFAGWQHEGATDQQSWGVIRVTTQNGIWTPIPVTCRAATISVSPSPPVLSEFDDDIEVWSWQLFNALQETQIMVEYRGIG